MAYIRNIPESELHENQRVSDPDNIIQIHRVHPEIMRLHYDLYIQLMHKSSSLTRVQKELVAVVVSVENACDY